MKIRFNPNKDIVKKIKDALRENDGYCPCALLKSEDTKCMCKEFRESKVPGLCHCELYEKYEEMM